MRRAAVHRQAGQARVDAGGGPLPLPGGEHAQADAVQEVGAAAAHRALSPAAGSIRQVSVNSGRGSRGSSSGSPR